jgi:hypothetical protein
MIQPQQRWNTAASVTQDKADLQADEEISDHYAEYFHVDPAYDSIHMGGALAAIGESAWDITRYIMQAIRP